MGCSDGRRTGSARNGGTAWTSGSRDGTIRKHPDDPNVPNSPAPPDDPNSEAPPDDPNGPAPRTDPAQGRQGPRDPAPMAATATATATHGGACPAPTPYCAIPVWSGPYGGSGRAP